MAKKAINLTQEQLLLVACVLVVGGYFLYTNYFASWGSTYEIYNRGDAPIECWMEQYLDGAEFTIPAGGKREWTPEQGWGSTDLGECYCPGWNVPTNAVDVGFYTQGFLGSPNYVDIDCGGGSTTTTQAGTDCVDSDGGRNYNVKGITTQGNYFNGEDFCISNTLTEYFCNADDVMDSENYVCPIVCSNGKCSSATTTTRLTTTTKLTTTTHATTTTHITTTTHGGTTTTTLAPPPCVGLACYEDVILGFALGVSLLAAGYFIYTKK